MSFYTGNKLLETISTYKEFQVLPTGIWNVIYADSSHKPFANFIIYNSKELYESNKGMFKGFQTPLRGELVVLGRSRFALKWSHEANFRVLSDDDLFNEYFYKGLIVKKDNFHAKPFNSSASSFYHLWQSKHSFVGGITDVDLVRFSQNQKVAEILEIKRSKIDIGKWAPYSNDKGGYEILGNLARIEELKFTIVYYHFDPTRGIEDIDNLLILRKLEGFKFHKIGLIKLEEFINALY